jgi:hypothetical protein
VAKARAMNDCFREPDPIAQFRVAIDFAIDGVVGREVYYVHDYREPGEQHPEAIAWRDFERELIDDWRLPAWECGCCLRPREAGSIDWVRYVIETEPCQ